MPVHLETTCKISSSPTTTRFSSPLARHSLSSVSSFSFACFSWSRIWAAPSKSWFLMAFSFLPLISSISASIALTSGGRVIVVMRAREPASSSTSIALSGKNRSVM